MWCHCRIWCSTMPPTKPPNPTPSNSPDTSGTPCVASFILHAPRVGSSARAEGDGRRLIVGSLETFALRHGPLDQRVERGDVELRAGCGGGLEGLPQVALGVDAG